MKKDRNNCYLLSNYLKYIWKGMTGYEYVEICYKTFQGNCFLLYFTELLAYCVNAIQWIDLVTRAPSVIHILNDSWVIQGKWISILGSVHKRCLLKEVITNTRWLSKCSPPFTRYFWGCWKEPRKQKTVLLEMWSKSTRFSHVKYLLK